MEELNERLEKYFQERFQRMQGELRGTESEVVVYKEMARSWYYAGATEMRMALMRTIQDQHARLMREIDPARLP